MSVGEMTSMGRGVGRARFVLVVLAITGATMGVWLVASVLDAANPNPA